MGVMNENCFAGFLAKEVSSLLEWGTMNAHRTLLGLIIVSCAISIFGGTVWAKPALAVLPFKNGDQAREAIIDQLGGRYEVVPGQELVSASERLGVSMSRGANLAQVAGEVGVVAIIGGGVRGNRLTLAVYSGKTGEPLVTGVVPFRGQLAGPSLRKAMALITRGLKKAPKKMPKAHKTGQSNTMTFTPDGGTPAGEGEENPLAKPKPTAEVKPAETVAAEVKPRAPREPGASWVEGLFGVGFWMRSFAPVDKTESAQPDPEYKSGMAFALRLGLRVRPAAFFLDNFASNFWLRLRYQQVVGLTSQTKAAEGATTSTEPLSTSMREIIFDFGYDWKILSRQISPHLDLGLGYGMTDFSIDWKGTEPSMPDFAYRFLDFNLAARWYFMPLNWGLLGAHVNFDYRLVFSAGEIQDEKGPWYGPSSTGGLGFGGGADLNIGNVLLKLDYLFNYYFYGFSDPPSSRAPNSRAAAGAMDAFNTIMLSAGYSY
jgi:hypothetical protein